MAAIQIFFQSNLQLNFYQIYAEFENPTSSFSASFSTKNFISSFDIIMVVLIIWRVLMIARKTWLSISWRSTRATFISSLSFAFRISLNQLKITKIIYSVMFFYHLPNRYMHKRKMQREERQQESAGTFSVLSKVKWPFQLRKTGFLLRKLLCLKTFVFSFFRQF